MERDECDKVLKGSTPTEIAEYFKTILPDLGDDAEDVLIRQESVYEYIRSLDYGQSSTNNNINFVESQVADDEALARALKMSEESFNDLHISPPTSRDNTRSNVTRPASVCLGVKRNEIDPDRMTYEQLQSLGDAVGHESKGLSKEVISKLPTSKHKVGLSKKEENEKCVICCVEFKKGDTVTSLPCAHSYHSDCITKWLQVKKDCPVCQKEVQ